MLFDGLPGFQARSAGTQANARIVVHAGHVGWADVIFVMERSHLNRLRRKLGYLLSGKRIVTLHIPDDYQFMQPELIDELRTKVGQHVEISDGFLTADNRGSKKDNARGAASLPHSNNTDK